MILIVFVALLLFGGEKLPEIARGLGKGIRDFKDASEGVKRELTNQIYNYEEKKTQEEAIAEASIPVAESKPVEDASHLIAEYSADEVVPDEHVAEVKATAINENAFHKVPNTLPVSDIQHIAAADHITDAPHSQSAETPVEPVNTHEPTNK